MYQLVSHRILVLQAEVLHGNPAAAAAGSARGRAGPVNTAERRARRKGPGPAQSVRRGGGGSGGGRPVGAACGLVSQSAQ